MLIWVIMTRMRDLSPKKLILSAIRCMLRPLVRLAVHSGVVYKEFSGLAKEEFVDVCAKDFGIGGRPTNISRITAMTGIGRKEVKRIRDEFSAGDDDHNGGRSMDRMTALLSGWHQDACFLCHGKPLDLPLEAPSDRPSIMLLAKKYAGDVPIGVLLKELVAARCIAQLDNNAFRALKRHFTPPKNDPKALLRASRVNREYMNTIFHNLYVAGKETGRHSLFEGRASNSGIPVELLDSFGWFMEREGQAFLERVDAWLSEHEHIGENVIPLERLGAGVYMFQGSDTADAVFYQARKVGDSSEE